MLTHFPEIPGALDPDFTEKPIDGPMVPRSRLTHLAALAGILDTDLIRKTHKWNAFTKLEDGALFGTCDGPISRLYQKTDQGRAGTELEAKTIPGTRGNSISRLYQKPIKSTPLPYSGITRFSVLEGSIDPDFIKKQKWGTQLLVQAGALDPDFTRKPIKGSGDRTRG